VFLKCQIELSVSLHISEARCLFQCEISRVEHKVFSIISFTTMLVLLYCLTQKYRGQTKKERNFVDFSFFAQ
ncbi:hypothetical protein SFRURICE_008561, partial [Spodoptera frugiperda]